MKLRYAQLGSRLFLVLMMVMGLPLGLISGRTTSQEDMLTIPAERQGLNFDVRLVPEYEQVHQAMMEMTEPAIKAADFASHTPFTLVEKNFQVQVDSTTLYDMNIPSAYTDVSQYQPSDLGGLILLHIAVVNTSKQPLHFPKENLTLTFGEDGVPVFPSMDLFPLEFGNFDQVLEANRGIILPEKSIEGFLVFGVNSFDYTSLKNKGYFELQLAANAIPMESLTQENQIYYRDIPNQPVTPLVKILALPADTGVVDRLTARGAFLPSIVREEWWGDQFLIAEVRRVAPKSQAEILVGLVNAQVTDLQVRDEYRRRFRAYPLGQLLVNAQFDIINQSSSLKVISQDRIQATLTIGDTLIQESKDLALNGQPVLVLPGQTVTYSAIFVLDRPTYQAQWQGQAFDFKLDVPTYALDFNNFAQLWMRSNPSASFMDRLQGIDWIQEGRHLFRTRWIPETSLRLNQELQWVEAP